MNNPPGNVQYPRRPAWLYRDGYRLSTKHGQFVVFTTGGADLIWKQWGQVSSNG